MESNGIKFNGFCLPSILVDLIARCANRKYLLARDNNTRTKQRTTKKAKIRRSLIPYIPRTCTGNTNNYVMRADRRKSHLFLPASSRTAPYTTSHHTVFHIIIHFGGKYGTVSTTKEADAYRCNRPCMRLHWYLQTTRD